MRDTVFLPRNGQTKVTILLPPTRQLTTLGMTPNETSQKLIIIRFVNVFA